MVRKLYFYPLELRAGITKLLILDLSWNLLTMIKYRMVANLVECSLFHETGYHENDYLLI